MKHALSSAVVPVAGLTLLTQLCHHRSTPCQQVGQYQEGAHDQPEQYSVPAGPNLDINVEVTDDSWSTSCSPAAAEDS